MAYDRLTLTLTLVLSLGVAGATADDKVGTVRFPTSCSTAVQPDFERAVAMLHSFWFQASTNAFVAVAQQDPGCAIAHWGVAMNLLGNPFAWPPSPKALADGWAAVERAKAAGARLPRERDYVAAIEAFYKDAATVDHRTRALAYRQAMEQLAARYPEDREATIFYALALNATALPTDKTYADQLKAAGMLEKVFAEQPQHPGVAHYLIHSYDYPPIADKGLTAARRYAAIAPAAPHALHMPSHIFTRRGYWQESIDANRASVSAVSSHFDQLHALDYLTYAYLQMGQDVAARRVVDRLGALRDGLAAAKVVYWADQVEIQRQVVSAWVARAEGRKDEALTLLRAAAEREDATEKHPVTPGPLAPARELLADMLLEANEPAQALREYEAAMRVEPNRFRGLYGAARAAELSGDRTKARTYYS